MLYLWSILLVVVNTVWLVLVAFSLPGNWLIVITTFLFAWWRWEDKVFSFYSLTAIAILALAAELFEFFSGMGGARRAGAGRLGSIGAIIGAISGAVLGTFLLPVPLLGTLLGGCIGAGLGVWILEFAGGKTAHDSIRFGLGAGVGQFFGTTAKIAAGIIIWVIVAIAAFWP